MKIMATALRDVRKPWGTMVVREGQEARVVKVLIHPFSTDVTLELPGGNEKVNSVDFCYELVLPATAYLEERRVSIDIIDDLLSDDLFTGHRSMWNDDMPSVETSYVVIPAALA